MDKLYLLMAILCEVVATASLKATDEFTKLIPSIIVAVGYLGSFYFLTLSLKTLPLGIVYAVWSGLGIVFSLAIGRFYYQETYNMLTVFGITLIIFGVITIHLSKGDC